MKLILFGATGHTGRFVLDEALKAGYEVAVLVRHPEKLQYRKDNLRVMKGDALDVATVVKAVDGRDAVVSTISEGPHIVHRTQSVAVGNMITAMQQCGVRRIICMGASGILQYDDSTLIRDRPGYPKLYLPLSFEHSAVNEMLQAASLEWTQVCPPTILAAPSDGKYIVRVDYPPGSVQEVNAGNIGAFMMKELSDNEFLRKRVGITNMEPAK